MRWPEGWWRVGQPNRRLLGGGPELQAEGEVVPDAPANGPNCAWLTSPSMPGAEHHCCTHKQFPRLNCAKWRCLKDFTDCNGDLNTPTSDGCECKCAQKCNGTSCGNPNTTTKKAGEDCGATCDKCDPATLTCGPDTNAAAQKICCAPPGTACTSDADCCKSGLSPSENVLCINDACVVCAGGNAGDACTKSSDCCSPELGCVNNKCTQCKPVNWFACPVDKNGDVVNGCQFFVDPKDPTKDIGCPNGDVDNSTCCDTDDPQKFPPCHAVDHNYPFRACCPSAFPKALDTKCGDSGWCCAIP